MPETDLEITPPADLDNRTAIARQLKAILEKWSDDLRHANLSENQKVIARRAGILIIWVESCERAWANGDAPLPGNYVSAVSLLERLLSRLDRAKNFGGLAA